ncbi:UNVERIFIED_CONTAM: hypothetical protein PYX00_002781 [Menopon gallinae]|uniref:t-SNARE coiled-coil homology domain-containing protein n=1 Tax=Menopon gallinae TaxID=328185 RepID=A0AAW2HYN7_9NEOP
MGSLMDEYEQQYAVLTADITAKVSLLGNQFMADKKKIAQEIEKHMEESQELLEQMELEVRDVDPSVRPKYRMRVDSYKAELGRLSHEFVKARNPPYLDNSNSNDDYFVEGFSIKEEQKQRLLNNSEKLERTGNQLKAGYRLILETEEIGANILNDLGSQRETIERSRNRLRDTDAELNRSSRILSNMVSRSLQNKFILSAIAVIFVVVIIITIYFSV